MSFRSLSVHYSPSQSSRSNISWTSSTSASRSTASRPARSDAADIQHIASAIQQERHDKELAIIVVVPQRSLEHAKRRCRSSSLKFWKNQNKSLIIFTTPESLQCSLEAQFSPKRRRLSIIVSDQIRRLPEPFEVHSSISTLKILRSSYQSNNHICSDNSSDSVGEDELLLDGASTFHNIRLDDWLSEHRDPHLHLGHGVRIQIDNLDDFLSTWSSGTCSSTGSPASSSSATLVLSEEQQAAVREHLARMEGLPTDGSWWDRWKGPVAGVLGALAGTAQLAESASASARGVYLVAAIPRAAAQAGLAVAGLGAATAAAGPAVPAVAAVVAVGLVVYFVPWPAVFRHLREKVLPGLIAVAKMCKDAIAGFFEQLMSWLKSLLLTVTPGQKPGKAEEAHSLIAMRFPL